MKMWSFIFPEADSKYQSIRVAAPTKTWATLLLQPDLEGVDQLLCQFLGEARIDIGIIEKVLRSTGEIEEVEI